MILEQSLLLTIPKKMKREREDIKDGNLVSQAQKKRSTKEILFMPRPSHFFLQMHILEHQA